MSPIVEMAHLLAECVRHDLRCIAFCKAKKLCELVLRYAREHLDGTGAGHLRDAVRAYRGGYSASDGAARDGGARSSAANFAAWRDQRAGTGRGRGSPRARALHLGFPGSVASLTQQAGRAGRRGGRALGVYVAFDSPLDQRRARASRNDSSGNRRARARWSEQRAPSPRTRRARRTRFRWIRDFGGGRGDVFRRCASGGVRGFDSRQAIGSRSDGLSRRRRATSLDRLEFEGVGQPRARREHTDRGGGTVRGEAEEGSAIVEEIEASKAFWSVYPGAVYMNQARTYLCLSLGRDRIAWLWFDPRTSSISPRRWIRRGSISWNTRGRPRRTPTARRRESRRLGPPPPPSPTPTCGYDSKGSERYSRAPGRAFDDVDFARDMGVRLPEVSFRTVASWVRIPDAARVAARDAGMDFVAGVHAAAHEVINVLPMYVMADQSDVAAECFAGGGDRQTGEALTVRQTPGRRGHRAAGGAHLSPSPARRARARRGVRMRRGESSLKRGRRRSSLKRRTRRGGDRGSHGARAVHAWTRRAISTTCVWTRRRRRRCFAPPSRRRRRGTRRRGTTPGTKTTRSTRRRRRRAGVARGAGGVAKGQTGSC